MQGMWHHHQLHQALLCDLYGSRYITGEIGSQEIEEEA
jgi:hypothetical protein